MYLGGGSQTVFDRGFMSKLLAGLFLSDPSRFQLAQSSRQCSSDSEPCLMSSYVCYKKREATLLVSVI